MVGGVLLVSKKVFGLLSLSFILGGLLNLQGRFLFPFEGSFLHFFYFFDFCFMDLKLTPPPPPPFFLISAYRMERGHEEVLNS